MTAELVELGGQPADLVALPSALLDEVGVQHLDHGPMRGDDRGEPVDGGDVAFDHDALPLGGNPCLGVGGEPSFGLVETAFEQLSTLVQAGVADLEVLSTRRQRRGPRLEVRAEFAAGTRGVGLGLLVGLQCRQERFEFGDPLVVAFDVRREIGDRSVEVGHLGEHLAVLALCPGQTLRCRG